MKTKLLLLFCLISGITCGQITITYTDFSDAFSPGGATFNSYSTPINFDSTVSVFVGEASATAQYWDFSNYNFEHVGISKGINPADAPLINEFPTSNIVLFEKGWIMGNDTFPVYNYKELLSDKLLLLGLSDDTSVMFSYDPPAEQAAVPLEYGVTWNVESGSVTVDAFGTMKLPSGEYECLRLRWDNANLIYKPGLKVKTPSRSYIFYSKQIREVNILNIPEDQFNLTTVEIMGFSYSDRSGSAGIQDKERPSLAQNTPNPFSDGTVIRYQVSSESKVIIRVFDSFGKEVRTLVNGKITQGLHQVNFDARGLAPGMYFYQIQANGIVETKKMTLVK